jgi:hypothetical protein
LGTLYSPFELVLKLQITLFNIFPILLKTDIKTLLRSTGTLFPDTVVLGYDAIMKTGKSLTEF